MRFRIRLLPAVLFAALLATTAEIAGASPIPNRDPGSASVAELLDLGMPLSARSLFRTFPAAEQGASPHFPALLRRLFHAGYPEEAISLYREVLPRLREPVRSAAALAVGEILWDRGDRDSACRMFREASGQPDASPEASLRYGRCFAADGKFSGASALFSTGRQAGKGKLLQGYAEMALDNPADALAAWRQADGDTPAEFAAKILFLSRDERSPTPENTRALEEIALAPGAPPAEREAALESLSSLLLLRNDPEGALTAARNGIREAERWNAAAADGGAWDRTIPGGRRTWNALEPLFPFGEDASAFYRAGRRFLARIDMAEGASRVQNRLRETSRRLRGAEEAVSRSRETVSRAIRRAEEIRRIFRAAAERAAAMRDRLRKIADHLVLAEWGAETDPENFTTLEVADRRIRFLRDRLEKVTAQYAEKVRKEWSPPLSPEDRLMVFTAQIRLDRIEQEILSLASRMAFMRRTVWNRWKAEFVSRASVLLDGAEAIPPRALAGAEDAERTALRLREAFETESVWIGQLSRMRKRLARDEIRVGLHRAAILEDADRARQEAVRELAEAIARRIRLLHYLAARSATELLIRSPGSPAVGGTTRDALRGEAFGHWEAVLPLPGETGGPADEALYAMAELRYEEEERLHFAGPEQERGMPDHSGSLALFRQVVREHPGSPYREPALYGIALCLQEMGKAEESAGSMKTLLAAYPDTRFADEVHLRLGEDAFDRQDFERAAAEYRKVGGKAGSPDLLATARFKLGWSLFLRGKPAEAAGAFLSSLLLSREARKTGGVERESLRMVSRSLVEAGMEAEAEEFLTRGGAREYGPATLLAIQSILDAQNRYLEATEIADRFALAYPTAPGRIEAELSAAEALRKGNRMEESYNRKGAFHRAFGPGSRWQSAPEREASDIARANLVSEEGLRTALFFFHGQSRKSPPGDRPYILAGYDAYLALFPSSSHAGEIAFQRGWLLFEDGRKRESSAAFEAAADRFGGSREEAARYMAVQAMKDATTPADPAGPQAEVIRLARSYERSFPEGDRLARVLLDRARAHFNRREFRDAADAARRAAPRFAAGKDHLAALRLSGDARFELGEFDGAEKEFRAVLASADASPLAEEMRKWVGFSMFRRAEGLGGEEAARLFARVAEEYPGLEIAPAARFRSGTAFEEAGKAREAIAAFLSVESLPKNRSLSVDAARRLAVLYERTGNPLPAADRYERLGDLETGGEEKRSLLLHAAELFEGREEPRRRRILIAVASLPDTPAGIRISCIFQAAESAREEGLAEEADRLYRETLEASAAAPEGSPGPAGKAAWHLGEFRFSRYRALPIVPPLEKTFRAKQSALEEASTFFLEAIRIGDAETVSGSLHRLGEGLEDFRNALLASPLPEGLSAEEREEYRFLLEEKAAPVEEKAVEAYRRNLREAVAANITNRWVEQSLDRLKALRPALFDKRWEYAFPVVTLPVFRGIVERSVR